MKKITLLLFLTFISLGFSQGWTTGMVNLTSGFTVKFDVNTTTDVVTMTMNGPDDEWLGVGLSNNAYSIGGTMSQFNGASGSGDVIVYSNNSILDRKMPTSGNGTPLVDSSSDWSIAPGGNTTSGGVRTVVATRAQNSGDSNDYPFPDAIPSSFTIVWAKGGSGSNNSFGFHSGGRGAVLADNNSVLSDNDFQINPIRFTISPNPSRDNLNIGITYNPSRNYNLEVYDVLGKQIYRSQLTKDETSINASNWKAGVYLVKLSSDEATLTKRFIKQ